MSILDTALQWFFNLARRVLEGQYWVNYFYKVMK